MDNNLVPLAFLHLGNGDHEHAIVVRGLDLVRVDPCRQSHGLVAFPFNYLLVFPFLLGLGLLGRAKYQLVALDLHFEVTDLETGCFGLDYDLLGFVLGRDLLWPAGEGLRNRDGEFTIEAVEKLIKVIAHPLHDRRKASERPERTVSHRHISHILFPGDHAKHIYLSFLSSLRFFRSPSGSGC
jgi:hypothetical protein